FQASHAAAIGEWDAVSYSSASPPNLRRVDGSKLYPNDLEGTFHADGEIWSAALWDLRTALGRETVDRLVLESHFGLPANSTMADGAEAILAADENLNGGANQAEILQWFVARGILVQPDDHGNESDEATVISVPSQTAGEVDYFDDPDFFQFSAVAGSTYRFEVELGTSLDTTLTLLAGDDELATNDNGGAGSLLIWTAPVDLDFFLLVSGTSTGSYTLDVSTILAPADDHGDISSMATATVIPDVVPSELEVVGDVDVFSFDAVAGEGYLLEARLDTLEQSVLRILDSDGFTELAIDDDGEESFIYWSPDSTGTYYAEVSGLSQGTYDFAISPAEDDHGDDPFNATFVNAPSVTAGRIELFGDTDFFEFPTNVGVGYELSVVLDTLTDSTLRLFDVDGFTELEFDDDGGSGFSSLIEWVAPLTATYFLAVEGFDGIHNGIYDLRISTFTPAFDDHGNDASTATVVELDSVTQGELEQIADSDWFAITIPEGIGVILETTVMPTPDTTLTVYDSDGITQLAFDDDGGDGIGSRIEFSPPIAGTYFAVVRGFANNETGTYAFSVTRDVDGDFDNDEDYDCEDVDALVAVVAAETHNLVFDLNGDQVVVRSDLELWRSEE
ncbi:MAG: M36 family metallopeptidase, partial [Planctomycetota bacterium]